MNTEDIIRMAEQAGMERCKCEPRCHLHTGGMGSLTYFANLVAAAEREACAAQVGQQWTTFEALKDAHYRHSPEPFDPFRFHKDLSTIFFSRDMAYAIRARGQG
jgi:hypothetical protein